MIKQMLFTALTMTLTWQLACASESNINPSSGRLFNLSSTGNNLSIKSTIPGSVYQFAGIKSLTPGFSFTNCTPADNNGFCLFQLSDSTAATPVLTGPAVQPEFKLCLNGIGNTYSCERLQLGDRFAYVANNTSTPPSISLCSINSSTGAFGTCLPLAPTGLPSNIGSFALNPAGTILYVGSNVPNSTTISLCHIHLDGTLANCSSTDGNGTFNAPIGIALNNTGTLAYVTNYNTGTASLCHINSDGTLANCSLAAGTDTFSGPVGIALNNAGTLAYVANSNAGTVSLCQINSDGALANCSNSKTTFDRPASITLNNTETLAYVANFGTGGSGTTVSMCHINSDGTLANCSNSNGSFNAPVSITINNTGTLAYVSNTGNGTGTTVSICHVNADGTLANCSDSNGAFNTPGSIALF